MTKLTTAVGGPVIVFLLVASFIGFYGSGAATYNTVDYNASKLSFFNQSAADIASTANKTQTSLTELQGNPSALDILSAFFTSAFASVKIIAKSFGTIFSFVANSAAALTGLPTNGFINIVVGSLGTLLVLALIGILLHIVTKSDRT